MSSWFLDDTSSSEPETTLLDALECDLVASSTTPVIPAETAMKDRFQHCAEFDLTRGDSDDEPLIPSTMGAVPPFPTWVDHSRDIPDSHIPHSSSFSQSMRTGVRNVVPRGHACSDRDVLASAQIVNSSEIVDVPVTMVDSNSHALCQVVGRYQLSRRLVLCGDRGRSIRIATDTPQLFLLNLCISTIFCTISCLFCTTGMFTTLSHLQAELFIDRRGNVELQEFSNLDSDGRVLSHVKSLTLVKLFT